MFGDEDREVVELDRGERSWSKDGGEGRKGWRDIEAETTS